MGVYHICKLTVRYITTLFTALLCLPLLGQERNLSNRKSQIETYMKPIYSVVAFQQVADSLQLTIDELSDYPVIFPIKRTQRISSDFGMRKHPIYKKSKFHTGIDIPHAKGTSVYATGNGVVIRKGYNKGYGNYIEIQHAGGFRSFYAHLSKTIVNIGDSIEIAHQIACVGSTGAATGSHLHYEVRKGKRYLNPRGWCDCLAYYVNSKELSEEFLK